MKFNFIFDYDNSVIIMDVDGEKEKWGQVNPNLESNDSIPFHLICNEKGNKPRYGAAWPLAVLNYILYKGYPYAEDAKYSLKTDLYSLERVGTVVRHLNETVLKKYPDLHVNQKDGRFSESVNKHDISWSIKDSGVTDITDFHIYSYMQSSDKQDAIMNMIDGRAYDHNDKTQKPGVLWGDKNHVSADIQYRIEKIEEAVIWDDLKLEKEAERYDGRVAGLDKKLLPRIKAGNELIDSTLPEYILNEYINIPRDFGQGFNFAVVEGGSGSGKTYSLYETAKELIDKEHIAIVVEMSSLFGKSGKKSLLEHLRFYLKSRAEDDNELVWRNLLSKNADSASERKIVIIVDGIDEVFSKNYKKLADELNTLAECNNPNVFFVLGTRSAAAFTEISGIEKEMTSFTRWDNISLRPIALDSISRNKEKELYDILEKDENLRTPLFISYYREVDNLRRSVEPGQNDNADHGIQGYSHGNSEEIWQVNNLNNYYDLFNARTRLLEYHAGNNRSNSVWYSSVLPCLAYYLYTNEDKENEVNMDVLEELFSRKANTALSEDVYSWYNSLIIEEYDLFKNIFTKEKLIGLLNTGFIRSQDKEGETVYKFEHMEYMQFLAAKFASMVIRNAPRESLRNEVVDDMFKKTSFYGADGVNRVDKMRHIPFVHYVITDLSRSKNTNQSNIKIDTTLLILAANVAYEKYDVYDETKDIIENLLDYWKNKIRRGYSEIPEYEDWRLINAVNIILYPILTKRNNYRDKWRMLDFIYRRLNECAALVASIAFKSIGVEPSQDISKRTWFEIYNLENIDELITSIKEQDEIGDSFEHYDVDFLGRLYSNLGACRQEMEKYSHDFPNADIDHIYSSNLDSAIRFHQKALNYRMAVIDKVQNPGSISVIRSYITLATDYYYKAKYAKDYEAALNSINSAIEYHHKALKRQGVDPADFEGLDCSRKYEKKLEIIESPHVDAEAYVICMRIAGAWHLLYEKTKIEYERLKRAGLEEDSAAIKDSMSEQIYRQYLNLKAAYYFLLEECQKEGVNEESGIDILKLEIHSSEIDNLWKDCEDKYIYSFSELEDYKADGLNLLEGILELYRQLHVHSRIECIYVKSGRYFIKKRHGKDSLLKIDFPKYSEDRKVRIRQLLESAEIWCKSDQMLDLLEVFDIKVDTDEPFDEYIKQLSENVKKWDFRKRLADKKKEEADAERYKLEDETFWQKYYPLLFNKVKENEQSIVSSAISLGMDDLREINVKPDFILPVGGARMVNLYRPQMAKKLIDDNKWTGTSVVAIGGSRRIRDNEEDMYGNKEERFYVNKYAPDAKTEYEALITGMVKSFGLSNYTEKDPVDIGIDDVNWRSKKEWEEDYCGNKLMAIASPPITNAPRRANSYDGFLHFIKSFKPQKGDVAVMVTSNIYCQYQGLTFADIAIDCGLEIYAVGTDDSIDTTEYSGAVGIKYLQEIKATVDWVYKIMHPNSKYHTAENNLDSKYVEDVREVIEDYFSK